MLYFDLNHNVQFAENVAFCVWRAPRYFDILSTECLQSPEVAWRPLRDTLQTAAHTLRDTTRWNASLHDDPRTQANSVRVITTTVSQFDCFCKSDSDTNNVSSGDRNYIDTGPGHWRGSDNSICTRKRSFFAFREREESHAYTLCPPRGQTRDDNSASMTMRL